jgi:hypothetical protein
MENSQVHRQTALAFKSIRRVEQALRAGPAPAQRSAVQMRIVPYFVVAIAVGALGTACSRNASDSARHEGGHAHHAPHGGVLVEIGEHQANLEIVHDAAAGTLSIYVLDSHAENFVRLSAPSLSVGSELGGEARRIQLEAAANAATGETVGDTAHFAGEADWLKTTEPLRITVDELPLPAGTFSKIEATIPSD